MFVLSLSDTNDTNTLVFFPAVHSGTPGSGKISPSPYDQRPDSSRPHLPDRSSASPPALLSPLPTQSESRSSSQHTEGLFQLSEPSIGTMFWLHRLSLGFLLIHLAAAHVGTLAELPPFLRWRWCVKQRRKWRSTMLNVCFEWWGNDWQSAGDT